MKNIFWIGYAVVFLILVAGGYFMISGVSTENEGKTIDNDRLQVDLGKIKVRIDNNDLPNKRWPQAYNERFGVYTKLHAGLRERLEQYNTWVTNQMPADIDLFDGEFKKNWLAILNGLLKDGFSILDGKVRLSGLKNDFEAGMIHQDLGIPMTWVRDRTVTAISPLQRTIAEEQFWVQSKLISHFVKAEKDNNFAGYKMKADPAAGNTEIDLGLPEPGSSNSSGTVPGFQGIFFKGATQGGGGFGGGNPEKRDYIVKKEFTNEYVFTAKFKIRASSLDQFVNNMMLDSEMFFVIDSLDVKALADSSGNKMTWDPKQSLTPENEPPVNVVIKGRVLTFVFKRLPSMKPAG